MSKFDNLNPEVAFAPFRGAIGEIAWPKVCNDAKAMLGRCEKDIKTTAGEWKISATGKATSKDGNTVQLPLNNPATILLRFGTQIVTLSKNGGMSITSEVPVPCKAWIEQAAVKAAQPAATPATSK